MREMMDKLASYSLSDFILFSDKVYYRLFELYNLAIWPMHLLAVSFAFLIFYMLWKRPLWAGRGMGVILVVSWTWVAWAFLYQRFYQIHVVANGYALGFLLQAVLLAWSGVVKNRFVLLEQNRGRIHIGLCLLVLMFILYPFIAVIAGRSWLEFEMFALAPDPTVLVTLSLLWVSRASRLLYIIPIIWLLISGVTLMVM